MTPRELLEELERRSALYDRLSEELETVLEGKAEAWLLLREASKSVAETDRKWSLTPDGIKEGKIEREMNRHEKRISVIKAILRIKEAEARQQM